MCRVNSTPFVCLQRVTCDSVRPRVSSKEVRFRSDFGYADLRSPGAATARFRAGQGSLHELSPRRFKPLQPPIPVRQIATDHPNNDGGGVSSAS